MEDIEMPLIYHIGDMEMSGILLDLPFFASMSKELERV